MAWRTPTDGDVVSTPAVVDGVVYVGSDDGFLYALDLSSGARRWRADLGSPVGSSPAVGGGVVYAAVRDGRIVALDAATGTRRWTRTTGKVLPFPWGHESGDYYLSSPVLVDGMVIVGAGDGAVYALTARTGAVRWRAATGGRIRSSPAVADGRVYVGSFDGRVYCFDVATGAPRWRYDTYGASLFSGDFGFDRRSIQSSPAVSGGVVYIGARDGFVYAIDAATGALRWRYDHKVSWINSSPAVADGLIYDGSSDAHFIQALDTTGTEVWRTPVPSVVWSSPAVAGSTVYAGDGSGALRAFDRLTGKERWAFHTGASVFGSPVVAGGYVVFGSVDGAVYALRVSDGPAVDRAVFFDSTLVGNAQIPNPGDLSRYLTARGYRIVDSAGLGRFLTEHVADGAPSVVVFALDYAPASVLSAPVGSSPLRRYLEAGGKIVWPGPPPGIFPLTMPQGKIRLDWDTPRALTGVPHDSALFDRWGVRATGAGTRWGMPGRWRDGWSVDPSAVTEVLGVDDRGLAAAWAKRYTGSAGSGFVRLPSGETFGTYLAAEYRGP
jgi:outer membrane protein assembly factor BamB